jgi:hypothetical protein
VGLYALRIFTFTLPKVIRHELANLYQQGELLPVKYRFLSITPSLLRVCRDNISE